MLPTVAEVAGWEHTMTENAVKFHENLDDKVIALLWYTMAQNNPD
jgi:hypothetical protein